ncbi:MAG: YggT family protein [Pyrinomonadaceae bacterium]
MLIIERTYLFATWIVIAFVTGTIIVVLLRLIANYADLNPFTWSALTIRRLTDPLITPVRRALVGFGVDPKYAPLVTILITILLGWFGLQLVASLANTVAGVLLSLQELAIVAIIGYVLYGLLAVYTLLIFVRIVFSWAMLSYSNRVMRFLVNTTEPLLGPLRRIIPPLGMFDISPFVAFIILWLFQAAIAGTLLRGLRLQFVA